MQKPSNASDCSSVDRRAIAEYLYLDRGAADASSRCNFNSRLGTKDLAVELLKKLRLQEGEFLVDVGCGTGQHLALFSREVGERGRVLGVDFNPEAITHVVASGQAGLVANGAKLPLRSAIVDALTCNYAIYYFDDLPALLAEWRRVLKPGGRLVLSGPARGSNRELYEFHRAVTGCGPSDADKLALGFLDDVVAGLMTRAGFVNASCDSFDNPITFPDPLTFLDYWAATSLFARTPGASRDLGEAWFRDSGRKEVVITKCVSLLSAVRAAS